MKQRKRVVSACEKMVDYSLRILERRNNDKHIPMPAKKYAVPRHSLVVSVHSGFVVPSPLYVLRYWKHFPVLLAWDFPFLPMGRNGKNCFPRLWDFTLSLTEYTFMSPQSRKPDDTFLFNSNNCQRRKAISYLQGGVTKKTNRP